MLYHIVFLDSESTEVYCHSISNNSGTPLLLHHLHLHRSELPLTLQWYCCCRLHCWGWSFCLPWILWLHTVWQHLLKPGQSMNTLQYKHSHANCVNNRSTVHTVWHTNKFSYFFLPVGTDSRNILLSSRVCYPEHNLLWSQSLQLGKRMNDMQYGLGSY